MLCDPYIPCRRDVGAVINRPQVRNSAQRIKIYMIATIKLQLHAMRTIIASQKRGCFYDENSICLPQGNLSQKRHTKLYNAIPPFAIFVLLAYYF